MAPSRRAALRGLGAAVTGVISGCTLAENHPELQVFNRQSAPTTASVSMTRRPDGATVYSETFQLAADEHVQRQVGLPDDDLRITTDVRDGATRSIDWTPGGSGCCLEVHFEDDAIEYQVRSY